MRLVTFVRDCKPDLPRAVWIIQLGNVVNFFGFGLVLPFELIYLHDRRGFALPTSGLIVSTIMAVNVVCAAPAGALADRFGGKRLLFFGAAVSGLGYGSLAFAVHPWQAFLGSAVAGVGAGAPSRPPARSSPRSARARSASPHSRSRESRSTSASARAESSPG